MCSQFLSSHLFAADFKLVFVCILLIRSVQIKAVKHTGRCLYNLSMSVLRLRIIEETQTDRNVGIFLHQRRGHVNASDLIMKQSAQPSSKTKACVSAEQHGIGPGSMGNWFSLLYLQKCQLSSRNHSVEEWACIVWFFTHKISQERTTEVQHGSAEKKENHCVIKD